jgi:putative transcriptional regulator
MSRILKNVHSSAKRLHDAGYMNDLTMREFDTLCLSPCPQFTAKDVRRIRKNNHASQGVFAAFLNVGKTTVRLGNRERRSPAGRLPSCLSLLSARASTRSRDLLTLVRCLEVAATSSQLATA